MSILPASIFDRSSMSDNKRVNVCPDFSIKSTISRCCADKFVAANALAIPTTPFKGVRNSWLILARKSAFA